MSEGFRRLHIHRVISTSELHKPCLQFHILSRDSSKFSFKPWDPQPKALQEDPAFHARRSYRDAAATLTAVMMVMVALAATVAVGVGGRGVTRSYPRFMFGVCGSSEFGNLRFSVA